MLKVSATFMALALALPHESCHIHVTEWFLMAGVVATLTAVVNSLIEEVERILKHPKHRFILFLKAVRFPLFCMELTGFFAIFDLVNIALLVKNLAVLICNWLLMLCLGCRELVHHRDPPHH